MTFDLDKKAEEIFYGRLKSEISEKGYDAVQKGDYWSSAYDQRIEDIRAGINFAYNRAKQDMSWQPMETLPHNESVFLCTWIYNKQSEKTYLEVYEGAFDPEERNFYNQNGEYDLPFDDPNDFEGWMKIPPKARNDGCQPTGDNNV